MKTFLSSALYNIFAKLLFDKTNSMMDGFFAAAAAALVLFVVLIIIFLRRVSIVENVDQERELRPQISRRIVSGAGARRRQRALEVHTNNELAEDHELNGDPCDEKDELSALKDSGKIGTKKLRKLEEKAERRAHREAAELERQEKKAREETREEERRRHEIKREQEEAEKAAKLEEARLERTKREEEEYKKLKENFSVDEEGRDTIDEGEAQNLLEEFINHVKETKVVMLEDLATRFHLKTQDVIDRVKSLQAEGTLTGILDDRGKFIYITQDEYRAVAHFIKQRGRVSIAELSESINQVICLDIKKKEILIESH